MKRISRNFMIILAMLALSGMVVLFSGAREYAVPFEEIPVSRQIGEFTADELTMDPSALDLIQPDRMVFREYRSAGKNINLYIGYYKNMEKSDLAHSPLVCYQGQGWRIAGLSVINIPAGSRRSIRVNSMIVEKGTDKETAFYWFAAKEYETASLSSMRIRLFLRKLMGKPTPNCFIRVSMPVMSGNGSAEQKLLMDFIRLMGPSINDIFK
jgi:EpsI family protein